MRCRDPAQGPPGLAVRFQVRAVDLEAAGFELDSVTERGKVLGIGVSDRHGTSEERNE